MNLSTTIHSVPFIDLRQEAGFNERVQARWEKALANSQFIAGEAAKELNSKILDYTQAANFIPCANGTDAIQIALRAVGIGPGDKVLLPDFTFWATYEAIENVAATPVMVDICPEDFQMDFDLCLKAIDEHKPKAIILVHLYGWCSSRLNEFRNICKQKKIYLIEDGAQAIGSYYENESIFKSAFIATTSFYPAKVLGAAGDAGGIFTTDIQIAEICHKLANHGRNAHYGHQFVGWNSRMDELQAHFLCEGLEHLQARINSRRESEEKYLQFASNNPNLPLKMKQSPANVKGNGYLQVSFATTNYKDLSNKLKEKGISSGNVYPSPMSAQEGAKNPILVTKDKITYELASKVTNLPLFPYMKDEEINYVCEVLKTI
jgi:UDP-2-acetamido-2-deoxy-ribo-hexuluronate aminotransferase